MGAAENIPEVLLKLEQVEAQTGMKKSYIYREMEKRIFPPKHKVGGGTRWYQSDIQRWIRARRSTPQWGPRMWVSRQPTATAAERKRSPSGHRAALA